MKKVFGFLALALTLAACNKMGEMDYRPAQESGEITITAKLAPKSPNTKAVSDQTDHIQVTWAEHEHIAILYEVNSVKYAADAEITAVDGSGTATITFAVESGTPDDTPCTIVYPLAAAKEDHSCEKTYAEFLSTQDGTLNANLDVRVGYGMIQVTTPDLDVTTQPAAQQAIFKFTLGVSAKELTVTYGLSNVQITHVTAASATNSFYVALPPAPKDMPYIIRASNGTSVYGKNLTVTKEDGIESGKYYQTSITSYDTTYPTTVALADLDENYVVKDLQVLTGILANNVKISIADGATVTLAGITINGGLSESTEWAGITCEGNATLVLADGTANSVKPFHSDYAAINLHSGKTLTIQGSGSLTADARENYGYGAGIGGDYSSIYGNIVITGAANVTAYGGNGGAGIGGGGDGGYIDIAGAANVTAYGGYGSAGIGNGSNGIAVNSGDITIRTTGTVKAYGGEGAAGIGSSLANEVCNTNCGNILISQGIIVATGGQNAAGIGTGYAIGSAHSTCRNITIEHTVTSVTVTKGAGASECIGRSGYHSDCDTVTIDGVENATTSSTFLHFNSELSTTTNENDTWTLTHK